MSLLSTVFKPRVQHVWNTDFNALLQKVSVASGVVEKAGSNVTVAAAVLSFSVSTTNYIEIDLAGNAVAHNTSSFTVGNLPVAVATVDAHGNISLVDSRPDVVVSLGTDVDAPDVDGVTVVSKTADYVANAGEVVLVDSTGGDVNVTLPPLASTQTVVVKKISGDVNNVVVFPPTDSLVDGAASKLISAQYSAFQFIPDGANYWVL